MKVGIVLLAAGQARRFGSDKRLAVLPDGVSVLQASAAAARASHLPVLLCLNDSDRALGNGFEREGYRVHFCARAQEGMGGTLADAIVAAGSWDGVLVALGDMPFISPDTYNRVAAALAPGGICVPTYAGRRGHPVGFSREYFEALATLGGDSGAREIIRNNRARVTLLALDDPGITRDIDTPDDLASPYRR